MSERPDYDPRYLEGIRLFNECEYFEAHEIWEELWQDYQGPSRNFYKGLIQVAVCLHHFGNENTRGSVKLYHSSRNYLSPYQPIHEGLNLEQFIAQFDACLAALIESDEDVPTAKIDPELIPEIELETG